ncbi:MAG: hypothetical protein TREMPRED_004971 [Tremellales sp. Tagirdzhanova-0007]|nr:MAG: hypothetical protein TREMPRED_004971 [Tremellales sp. Tagirdzhanova-0007]
MAPMLGSGTKTRSKPYDRHPSQHTKRRSSSKLGAPAQLSQTSRKGKQAWRKNIDVSGIEDALESARLEERTIGGRLSDKKNVDLFVIDTLGDVEVAKRMRRAPKPLRSLAVLSERSAIPSLSSRPVASARTKVASAEKARLRRIARRNITGTEGEELGSADVKKSASQLRDAWLGTGPETKGDFGEEGMRKRAVKPPTTLTKRREIYVSSQVEGGRAIELPEGGVSYNPTAESHKRLLDLAVKEEMERLRMETVDAERIKALGDVVNARRAASFGEDHVGGMVVGPGEVDTVDSEVEGEGFTVKATRRKTRAERNKTLRQREAVRTAEHEASQKKLLRSVASAPAVKASLDKRAKEMIEAERWARLAKREGERFGLQGGEKIGKHRLGKGSVAVQLGENLAESLRQIKPEGNLFKDRFLALQKRALIEPRVPQLPKRRTRRVKEYEKHAYKRFT